MTQEEQIKELKTQLDAVTKELKETKSIITNLGGSLEFKNLVQTYALGSTGSSSLSSLSVTQKFGLFGATAIGQQANISAPTGGATIDAEARTAINSILTLLDNFGFTV